MGSPFAPVLANIFMGFHESKWLNKHTLNKPKFHLRYVDDILDKSDVHYFKLPYIRNLSHHIKNKLSKLCKEFCKENFNIKLAFNSFKIKNYFLYKDPIPNDLKSFLVYKFTCASCSSSCSSSYIDETCHHFKTRIDKHIKKYNKSHILKHLHSGKSLWNML